MHCLSPLWGKSRLNTARRWTNFQLWGSCNHRFTDHGQICHKRVHGPVVYSTTTNFTMIGLYCRRGWAKNSKFHQICNCWGCSCTVQEPLCTLSFHLSWPLWYMKVISRFTVPCQIRPRLLHCVAIDSRKTPNFYCIFNFNTLWWRRLAAQKRSWVHGIEIGPSLPNGVKIISIFKCLNGEVISRNGQTTSKFRPLAASEVRYHPTRHGDGGGPSYFCAAKSFADPTYSFSARWRSKFQGKRTSRLNPHNSRNPWLNPNKFKTSI